jgi:hypothetical protein
MQQRRVRLGDIVDDYCPRERRITNHAVVAMIDDTVKQTRCTTCDADHEYREAKIPSPRRRKPGAADGVLVDTRPRRVPARAEPSVEDGPPDEPVDLPEPASEPEPIELAADAPAADADVSDAPEAPLADRDEWPVHRPLIRATLPRPEGQAPERKTPDFTFRPAGGRFDPHRNGQRKGGHRPTRHAHGQASGSGSGSGQGRFGGPRTGSGSRHGAGHASGQSHGQRQGNRTGTGGNRPGPNRGPRAGGGRKRGR